MVDAQKPQGQPNALLIDGKPHALSVTRNMSFWHQWLSCRGHSAFSKDFGVSVPIRQVFLTLHGTQTHFFASHENMAAYERAILEAIDSEEKVATLKRRYESIAQELFTTLDACLNDLSLENWKTFIHAYTRYTAGLHLTTSIGRAGVEALTKCLTRIGVRDTEIPEVIGTITYPSEHTPLFDSRLALLRIGASAQAGAAETAQHEALEEWLARFRYIPVNFCEEPWTFADAQAQLASVLAKDCKAELEALETAHEKKIADARTRLEQIGDAEVTILAHALAEGTYLNEYRKGVFSKVSLGYRPLFARIARLGGSKNWRDCFFLKAEEMEALLAGEHVDIPALVKARQVIGGKIDAAGSVVELQPDEVRMLHEYVAPHTGAGQSTAQPDAPREIQGFSASRGTARGVVKVVLGSKDFHKLKRGDILVTTMTSVDFVPVMEKAGAFVTNEGGITSHASIVAREMGKPCIIGTRIATQALKDGDVVEVDAEKGIVRKLA